MRMDDIKSNTVKVVKSPQDQEDLDWRPEAMQTPEERGVKWRDPDMDEPDEELELDPKGLEPVWTRSETVVTYPTKAAAVIFAKLVPEWTCQFLEKNAAYGEDPAPLGPGAEFVEIWRKAKKLRRSIWDGEEIGAEGPREVAMDLIGHCFLLIELLDKGYEIGPEKDG